MAARMQPKLCECGCGQPTPTSKRNRPELGYAKGEPLRFIHGHNGRGPMNARYNGGLCYDKSKNRWFVCCKGGKLVAWYRVVTENVLGRPLRSTELIHHLNGDPTDDRPENLEVIDRASHINEHRHELIVARRRAVNYAC